MNFDSIVAISFTFAVGDLPLMKMPAGSFCNECQLSKLTRFTLYTKKGNSKGLLDLVRVEFSSPIETRSFVRERYFMLLRDDYSRMIWATFLKKRPVLCEI